jgi:hypothetical protein
MMARYTQASQYENVPAGRKNMANKTGTAARKRTAAILINPPVED